MKVSPIVGLVTLHLTLVNTGPVKKSEEWKKKDPIENLRKYLLENEIASAEELDQIQEEVKEAVEASVKFAEESPFPPLESAFEDIYAD